MTFFPPGHLRILPSAMAVARERLRILSEAPDRVIIDPKILTFRQLEMKCAAEIGLVPISDPGREMLVEHLVRSRSQKPGWPINPPTPGLCHRIASLLDDLKSWALSPEDLFTLADGLIEGGKLSTLVWLYEQYETYCRERNWTDRAGRRRSIIQHLIRGRPFRCLASIEDITTVSYTHLTLPTN